MSCEIQEKRLGMTIGSAEVCGGLYLIKTNTDSSKVASASILQNKLAFSQADRDIMLHHYRLGHPNFVYLKKMFPKLFINKDIDLFQCDVCKLSKHTRSTYTPTQYVPSKPFSVLHSDI